MMVTSGVRAEEDMVEEREGVKRAKKDQEWVLTRCESRARHYLP